MSGFVAIDGVIFDDEGLERARLVAQWELGDPGWADMLVAAYLAQTDAYEEARDGMRRCRG